MLLSPEKERGMMVGEGEDEFLLRFEKTKYMYVCGEGRMKVKESGGLGKGLGEWNRRQQSVLIRKAGPGGAPWGKLTTSGCLPSV